MTYITKFTSIRRSNLAGSAGVAGEQLLHRNLKRFRDGLVFKAHRLCVALNSRLESNKEEGEVQTLRSQMGWQVCMRRVGENSNPGTDA